MDYFKIYKSEFYKLESKTQKCLRIFIGIVFTTGIVLSNVWTMQNYIPGELIPNLIQPLACSTILYFTIFIKRAPAIYFITITAFFWVVFFLHGPLFLLKVKSVGLFSAGQVMLLINLGAAILFAKPILSFRKSVKSEMKKLKK